VLRPLPPFRMRPVRRAAPRKAVSPAAADDRPAIKAVRRTLKLAKLPGPPRLKVLSRGTGDAVQSP